MVMAVTVPPTSSRRRSAGFQREKIVGIQLALHAFALQNAGFFVHSDVRGGRHLLYAHQDSHAISSSKGSTHTAPRTSRCERGDKSVLRQARERYIALLVRDEDAAIL